MTDTLLVLNAGSSSVKFALFSLTAAQGPRLSLRGQLAGIGGAARFTARAADEDASPPEAPGGLRITEHADAIEHILAWLEEHVAARPAGIGHRVVHGGRAYSRPVRLGPRVIDELEALSPLAPHHQPHNLAAIRAVTARAPDLPQVACFDTAFHATQPAVARRLPLPRHYAERGLVRYGFHGLSYEYVVRALPAYNGGELPHKLVVAHLGNGASLCAVADGESVATTMGFSTLDGVPMGTRSGAVDPGVLLHLMREEGMGEGELTDLLYNRCGLLGVSGLTGDMAQLLASTQPEAAEAIELFCYSLARSVGSLAAALEGLDALVFTGGIGEHATEVRASVCRRLAWLGLSLDAEGNAAGGPCISVSGSAVRAWTIPTHEELMIARHTAWVLGRAT